MDDGDTFKLEITELPRNNNDGTDDKKCPIQSIPKIKYQKFSANHEDRGLSKLQAIRCTLDSLESSLKLSRGLEAEQWLRHSLLKTEKTTLSDELKEADRRNKNMLNLFRRNVTDFEFGTVGDLPQNLRKEVQLIWHRKYDALLKLNEQLKSEISHKDFIFEDKCRQVDVLEQRLLNMAETLTQREETVKNICTKYLTLKKRKDEQEVLMRRSIEALEDALREAKTKLNPVNSATTLTLRKEALPTRMIEKRDRLAQENSFLQKFLRRESGKSPSVSRPPGRAATLIPSMRQIKETSSKCSFRQIQK